ncbi:nucleotide exchange factor GrpE [Maribellus sp. YY47]|uniref:nucleotide exchange factor GrpE n=1 Tax=Maribellus sp. YY47 TaxID=2929486 RepID=UPI002001A15F|nr:nucleotide exchange factor GrpE [Maribellus sp. YY47]MCK3684633.1 nucleotide exchange factor GrpE [Maribellus sp. YY47]
MAEEKISNETTSEEVKDTKQESKETGAPKEHAADEKADKKKKGKKDKHEVEIEELSAKLDDMKDKHLRLQAEFDNFRKRTLKEKADLIKSGGETVLVNILPVVDDFERALDSMKEVSDEDAGKQGTMLIYNKFREFLKQNNIKEIEALNQVFDVDLHEAITKIPAPNDELKGKVVDVIQKGYCLNEKVIRFAKVVIGE